MSQLKFKRVEDLVECYDEQADCQPIAVVVGPFAAPALGSRVSTAIEKTPNPEASKSLGVFYFPVSKL
jgi:hypothetical protein